MPSRTRFSGRRGARRVKKELIWTSVLFENVSPAITSGTSSQLVAPVDWVRSTNISSFQKGCVLVRIRGWLDFFMNGESVSDSLGTANHNFYAAIWKSEEDEDLTLNDWSVSAAYNSEDILWVGGAALPGSTNLSAAGVQLQQPQRAHVDIDVKAKRKLNSEETILLTVATGAAPGTAAYSGVLRCLLQLP